ncbi:Hypothetical predicted protein, partial [Marmota monax]
IQVKHEIFPTVRQSLTNKIDCSLGNPRSKTQFKNRSDSPGRTCLEGGPSRNQTEIISFPRAGRSPSQAAEPVQRWQ